MEYYSARKRKTHGLILTILCLAKDATQISYDSMNMNSRRGNSNLCDGKLGAGMGVGELTVRRQEGILDHDGNV